MKPWVQQSWCPSCEERTVLRPGIPCAFCETTLVKRRGGYLRPDVHGRISHNQAVALHIKYMTGVSAAKLGRELYEVLGYTTGKGCAKAIMCVFRRYSMEVRSSSDASRLQHWRNGLSVRDMEKRRRRRRAAGLTQAGKPLYRMCGGTQVRGGRLCRKRAALGSRFCQQHDPVRRQENLRMLNEMRERRPRPAMISTADVLQQLQPFLQTCRHPAAELSRATGVSHGECSRLLLGRRTTISENLATRLLAATISPAHPAETPLQPAY